MSDKEVCPKCGKVDCPCDPDTCECESYERYDSPIIDQESLVQDFEE